MSLADPGIFRRRGLIKYVIRNDDEHCNVESIYYLLYVT